MSTGFFRAFIKALVDQSESFGAGVWLLNADSTRCELWMAYIGGRFYTKDSDDWDTLTLPRSSLATHLRRLPARVDRDDRIHGRRPAPACARARFQSGVRCRVGGHRAPPAANSQSRMGGARDGSRLRLRERVASSASRGHGAAGDAGVAPQSPGGAESRRGAAAGGARRTEPDGARHSRHARPGIRRHPDAAAGSTAIGAVASAGGCEEPRGRRRSRAHAHDRRAAIRLGSAAAVARGRGRAPRRSSA